MKYNRGGIGEIHPANCELTAADVAAIAMIRNNARGLDPRVNKTLPSKLHSCTDKFRHFYACVRGMTVPPAPRKHVNNFRCDLFRDACKTTRSGAMNTDRIMIPRSYYCNGHEFADKICRQSTDRVYKSRDVLYVLSMNKLLCCVGLLRRKLSRVMTRVPTYLMGTTCLWCWIFTYSEGNDILYIDSYSY